MNDQDRTQRELREAVLALGAGEATEAQRALLDRLVRTDPSARSYVAQIMRLQAGLAWRGPRLDGLPKPLRVVSQDQAADESSPSLPVVTSNSFPLESPQSPAQSSAVRHASPRSAERLGGWSSQVWPTFVSFGLRSSWPRLGLAAAILVSLGFSLGRISLRTEPVATSADVPAPMLTTVARLTNSNGCNWAAGGFDPVWRGDAIHSGEQVTLLEGLAQLRLESGMTLDVEGPAALLITSTQSFVMQYGKVVVDVPPGVGEVKVQLPTCRVSATQGEFGIRAAGGDVDLHVFDGDATAALSPFEDEFIPESPDVRTETIFVPRGEAVTLTSSEGLSKVSRTHMAEKSEFATKLSMAGPLPVDDRYVDAVRAAEPFAYWRFESSVDGQVPNEIGPMYPLHLFGEVRWSGDQSNRVAEFGSPGASSGVTTRERVNELHHSNYSIEFWMKPSHFHHGSLVSLISQQREVFDLHSGLIEIRPPYTPAGVHNRIRFLHREPAGVTMGTSCYSGSPYRLRSWQHVVAVKEGADLRLYVDGVKVAQGRDPTWIDVPPFVLVGQLRSNHRGERSYVGLLDELSMYDRALNETEIREHFAAVEWSAPRQGRQLVDPRQHVGADRANDEEGKRKIGLLDAT